MLCDSVYVGANELSNSVGAVSRSMAVVVAVGAGSLWVRFDERLPVV